MNNQSAEFSTTPIELVFVDSTGTCHVISQPDWDKTRLTMRDYFLLHGLLTYACGRVDPYAEEEDR